MQSRLASLLESLANILIGYGIATYAQLFIFQAIGQPISLKTSAIVGAFMTLVSIVRSYTLRRIFNRITIWRMTRNATSHQNAAGD